MRLPNIKKSIILLILSIILLFCLFSFVIVFVDAQEEKVVYKIDGLELEYDLNSELSVPLSYVSIDGVDYALYETSNE